MNSKHNVVRVLLPVALLAGAFSGVGCNDRKPATPATSTPPTPMQSPAVTSPPATTSAPTSNAPAIAPGTGTDVVTKKGTETGMVGGESGTVAASGKPGTGTASGAGTGASQASGDRTVNKK